MNKEKQNMPKRCSIKHVLAMILAMVIVFSAGVGAGFLLKPQPEEDTTVNYAANPAYDDLVAGAAWQMSAEAHALMMQGFHIAQANVDEMIDWADNDQNGYHWVEEEGEKKLYLDEKRVCVVCDIDDTLVDGVHYTANILGKDGEWTNKAFTDFIQSAACTALPGAVDFTNYCVENGLALFYVTNRYDQGYKVSETGYAGQEGYKKADGTVIGASTYDIFGKTMFDITMESMEKLGFPVNRPGAANFFEDAILIVNDTKLNGSSKEGIRQTIANGGTMKTGERVQESEAYPETVDLSAHHVALLLGDDLNDISQIFSDSENAVERVELAIENMEKWGASWIVFPNSVYGSSMNFAKQDGYPALFEQFDYTNTDSQIWNMYD